MIPSLSNISSHYPLMLHLNLFYLYFDLHCEFSFFLISFLLENNCFAMLWGFCRTTMQVACNHTDVASLLSLLPASCPRRVPGWALPYTTSHQLYISHTVVYVSLCYFLRLSHSLLPPLWIFYMFGHLFSDPKKLLSIFICLFGCDRSYLWPMESLIATCGI